jgi:HK97 family phage major capsid protein
MNPDQLKMVEERLDKVFDVLMEEKLKPFIGAQVAAEVKGIVDKLRLERALFGQDRTGLTDERKLEFAKTVQKIAFGKAKSGEALISEQDNRGGYLISTEVAAAIQRIAASVGLVMSQAQKWPMSTDELDIPAYTGSFLEGEYLGVDAVGSDTALTFDQAKLITKKWQLSFVVGNDLLADASVNLADWLLALGGEALANMIDKQAFAGTSAPFIGILSDTGVTVNTITGTTFALFKVIDDASDMIGALEESVLNGAAFYMNRTVWAKLRVQKGTNEYILPYAGAASNNVLAQFPRGGGVTPAGEILGYPVFTSRHFPANSATAVSTKFMAFGNLKAFAYGDKGTLGVEEFRSGNFGGKEIAKSDQRGLVYKHRHALVNTLSAAFVVAKTAAS